MHTRETRVQPAAPRDSHGIEASGAFVSVCRPEEDADEVKHYWSSLHSELTWCLDGGRPHTLQHATQGNGLLALRHIMGKFEPINAQSKRAFFKAIIAT